MCRGVELSGSQVPSRGFSLHHIRPSPPQHATCGWTAVRRPAGLELRHPRSGRYIRARRKPMRRVRPSRTGGSSMRARRLVPGVAGHRRYCRFHRRGGHGAVRGTRDRCQALAALGRQQPRDCHGDDAKGAEASDTHSQILVSSSFTRGPPKARAGIARCCRHSGLLRRTAASTPP